MAKSAEDLEFDPIALLRQELEATERAHRLRAVKGLDALACVCKEAATREKLVPALFEHVRNEEEDEVQYRIAQNLNGRFVDRCGGPEHAHLLFEPLKHLARVEETMVRTSAVASLKQVFGRAAGTGADTARRCVDVIEALAGEEVKEAAATGFGAKCSAAALCAAAATLLEASDADEADKKRLREAYARVASNEAPIVRRAAASQLAAVVRAIADPASIVADLSATIGDLVADTHDCVRLLAVEELGAILDDDGGGGAKARAWAAARREVLKEEAGDDVEDWRKLEPGVAVVLDSHADASWRVREALARSTPGFLAYVARGDPVVGGGESHGELGEAVLAAYAALFEDSEMEVRAAAVRAAPAVATAWTSAFAAHADTLAALSGAAADAKDPKVRAELGTALTRLLGVVSPKDSAGGERDALQRAQANLFEDVEVKLFCDEESTSDVQLAVLRELKAVIPRLEDALVERVASMVKNAHEENGKKDGSAGSHTWRIYTSLIALYPEIAAVRGKAKFEFDLLDEFLRSFENKIAEVRVRSVNVLAALRDLKEPTETGDGPPVFDGDWLMAKIGEELSERMRTVVNNNLNRITFVMAYRNLAHANSEPKHMDKIVLFLVEAARDDVPNVRFTAVDALSSIAEFASDVQVTQIKRVLNELKQDTDMDVAAYVAKAIAAL